MTPDPAQAERDSIVAWMRRTAERYAAGWDCLGIGYAVVWSTIADLIEKKADKEPAP
jgi:hypothetical protein